MTPATPDPPVPATVAISPAAATFRSIGDTVRMIVTVSDQYGQAMSNVAVVWNSSDTAVAAVTEGLVTAVGNGSATVTATAGSATASAEVAVEQSVAELTVSPATHALVAIGDTARFVAEARDGNGHVVADAQFVWSSDDESTVTVDTGGLATSVANGIAQITATSGSATASAEVTVEQRVAEVNVSPPPTALEAFGDTVRLSAYAMDSNGHSVAGTAFTWTSGDTLVAVVGSDGLVTAVGNGKTEVTAAAGAVAGAAALTVSQQPSAVVVSPLADTLEAFGGTVRLSAEAVDANGHAVAGTAFSWTSGDTLIAAVDRDGLVTAVGNGTAEITAATGTVTGSAAVTVAQQPGTVVVSPMADTLVAFGDTVRLSAEAMDANGHAAAGTTFAWTSGDTLIAVVDSTGLVTAMGNGVTRVAAASGEAVGDAIVTVMQSVESVIVTPSADSVAIGGTLSLSAEALDPNGHAVVEPNFSWSSSNGLATVDADGLVYGFAEGEDTISAEAGSARGTAQITVFNPDRAALVALYEATDGPNWVNSENWLTDAPLGDWYGVRMLGDRVGYLDIESNGLNGSIPAQLGTLTSLRLLRLGDNALTGPIPGELGKIRNLRFIILNNNKLSGPIPPELGKLSRLIWLMLDDNALTGPIPAALGDNTSLEVLSLDQNKLSGPIPPELGKLKNLRRLNVTVNPGLRGEIPSEVLALNMDEFESFATGLCVPRTGDFDSYITRDRWIGYACGETEPGFQIQLLFHPDVPENIREAMHSQAEYWMEILRDTEAPDLFGDVGCTDADWWTRSRPDVIDDIIVPVSLTEGGSGTVLCGWIDLFRYRIPYEMDVRFAADGTDPRWLELIARAQLGYGLGIGELWRVRGMLMNPSKAGRVRDTYVVSPLARRAFDAAGGTSYTGPKVPVQQYGDGGRNNHWRTEVFGSELMSWRWSDYVPTSAITLQALADLGYTVDLSLADPYTLPSAAAAAALGEGAPPPFELGWEAPPSVFLCRPRVQLVRGLLDDLLSDSRRSVPSSNDLRADWMDARATPRADCEDLMRR